MGHDVKALGIGYTGQEHGGTFSLIPCGSPRDAAGVLNNLKYMWKPDVVVVALDIHFFQEMFYPVAKKLEIKYICITPLESEPLCMTWANLLGQMNKVFFISEFGTEEAKKAGVNAEHLKVGIDTKSWRLRTNEEYLSIRKTLGFEEDDFVVLTVADNQERKNLSAGLEIISELKKVHKVKVKHILVTREDSMVGWKLYDLAMRLGISSDLRVFKSGLPFAELYMLYVASDAFLLCSKGEGLGIPVMESMAVGIPVVANKVGAIHELLESGRGFIVEPEYQMIDPFGNQNRYFINKFVAVQELSYISENKDNLHGVIARAREFVEQMDWSVPAEQLAKAIGEIVNEQGLPVS
jgi:glycosyltransferase involved in cell wall biosynthesis